MIGHIGSVDKDDKKGSKDLKNVTRIKVSIYDLFACKRLDVHTDNVSFLQIQFIFSIKNHHFILRDAVIESVFFSLHL